MILAILRTWGVVVESYRGEVLNALRLLAVAAMQAHWTMPAATPWTSGMLPGERVEGGVFTTDPEPQLPQQKPWMRYHWHGPLHKFH